MILNKVRQKIKDAQIEEAIDLLLSLGSNYQNDIIILQSRLNNLKNKISSGVISIGDEKLEYNQIVSSLINFLSEIEKNSNLTQNKKELDTVDEKILSSLNATLQQTQLLNRRSIEIQKGIVLSFNTIDKITELIINSVDFHIGGNKLQDIGDTILLNQWIELINQLRIEYQLAVKENDEDKRKEKLDNFYNNEKQKFIKKTKELFIEFSNKHIGIRIFEISYPGIDEEIIKTKRILPKNNIILMLISVMLIPWIFLQTFLIVLEVYFHDNKKVIYLDVEKNDI